MKKKLNGPEELVGTISPLTIGTMSHQECESMLAPAQRGFTADLSNLQHLGPDDRVAMHDVLEPGNSSHAYKCVSVSAREMKSLKAANQAIDDTWQVLSFGSGNQSGHVQSSQGESYKRTNMSYSIQGGSDPVWGMNTGYSDPLRHMAFVAASVQAGNCDQMADVNLLLLSASDVHTRVALMGASDVGHAYVRIGDARESSNFVISDAWPEFGRALRSKDFALAGRNPNVVREYDASPDPDMRQRLLNAPKWSQSHVDSHFEDKNPQYRGLQGEALANTLLHHSGLRFYKQVHASKNLGVTYHHSSSSQTVDQSLSMQQFNERLVKSGHPPIVPPQPTWAYQDIEMSDAQSSNSMENMDVDMYFNDDPYGGRW
ncbi:Hrp-dependent type III effector protein [Pseudomonas syringae]|uniref:Hrp-dependent type III effector protein n=1 Tax=Pseudomonas syringae TaxID=317 RepID=UPI001F08305B|nr:Hrp-dependent type III effector protein [Pseudomonas syringae]